MSAADHLALAEATAADARAGTSAPNTQQRDVVGRCYLCSTPHDEYDHTRGRCVRCRALVLACPKCIDEKFAELEAVNAPSAASHSSEDNNSTTTTANEAGTNDIETSKETKEEYEALLFCSRCNDFAAMTELERQIQRGETTPATADDGAETFEKRRAALEAQIGKLVGRRWKSKRKAMRRQIDFCRKLQQQLRELYNVSRYPKF